MADKTLDYKTLFAGACVLVSLLAGGYWSYYSQQQQSELERLQRHIDLLIIGVRENQRILDRRDGRIEVLERRVTHLFGLAEELDKKIHHFSNK